MPRRSMSDYLWILPSLLAFGYTVPSLICRPLLWLICFCVDFTRATLYVEIDPVLRKAKIQK